MPEPIPHSLVRRLREVPIFADLSDDTLLAIVGDSANLRWPADSGIFAAGDDPEALYVVLRGEVVILAEEDGDTAEVARLGRGDHFGEQSLLTGAAHPESARAVGDTELLVIPGRTFSALLDAEPDLRRDIRARMERRSAGTDAASADH